MSDHPHDPPPNSVPHGSHPSEPPRSGHVSWAGAPPPPLPDLWDMPLPSGPKMPLQLQVQRIMLFLMPLWTALLMPNLIVWEDIRIFGVSDALLALWLMLPGAAALVCGLLLRKGGRAVLFAVMILCVVIVLLNIWFFQFGGPPVLQAIPFTVLTAIPLGFPSSWSYGGIALFQNKKSRNSSKYRQSSPRSVNSSHWNSECNERPPVSVWIQRFLLWFLAVISLLSAASLVVSAGGMKEAVYSVGYVSPFIALGIFVIVLARKTRRGASWVRVSVNVLYSVLMVFQVATFLGGGLLALFGFLVSLFGLILANLSSSRDFFRKTPCLDE